MGLLPDHRKLDAAASSLHQYYPAVRSIFPGPVAEQVIESIAVLLYLRAAREVFGRRFAERLSARLGRRLRHASEAEVSRRMDAITRRTIAFESEADELLAAGARESAFEHHVRCVLRALLVEAGFDPDDAEVVHDRYMPLMDAARRLAEHLRGIKRQNPFMMRG